LMSLWYMIHNGGRPLLCRASPDPADDGTLYAQYKLACRLRARPDLYFQAAFEGWDMPRIVREVY
jgi:hypothetical protein